MKKLLILLTVLAASGIVAHPTQAQTREYVVKSPKRNLNDGLDRYYNKHRTKTVYIIENHRPVRRDVFIDERGRYYREDAGRRVFIERHYDSYPSQYFYRDGRVRPGISVNF